MYKVYHGGGGRPHRVEDAPQRPHPVSPPPMPPPPFTDGPVEPIRQAVESLLGRITLELETEDLILLLIVYLMYRESGELELLFVLGALLLL
jgi:hypothetical protein